MSCIEKMQEITDILARFSYIPEDLIKYVKLCFERNQYNRLTDFLLESPHECSKRVNNLFEFASKATNLSPSELLKATDFDIQDIDRTRIESAFAELRAINFLNEEGFNSIIPIRSKGKQVADIIASRHGTKYAVEVTNSSYYTKNRWNNEQFSQWLLRKLIKEKKMEQLKVTMAQLDCERSILIAVLSNVDGIALNTFKDYEEDAKQAWEIAGKVDIFHIAFVTGQKALGYGLDDCVFPSWP